ncbi:hypothetical protein MTO96_022199 [Rhipicephalus appendiculatus]
MSLQRQKSKSRIPGVRSVALKLEPSREPESFMTQTDWVPGRSDVHLPDLHQGTVTFCPITTDIDGDDGMHAELVDGPNLRSSTHLLMILLFAVAVVAAIAVVLAMLDVPFASERAARTPPPNYRRAAVLGTDLVPPNHQGSDAELAKDVGPRPPLSVGSSGLFLAHNTTTPSTDDSDGSSPSPITMKPSSFSSTSVKHRHTSSTAMTVNVTDN